MKVSLDNKLFSKDIGRKWDIQDENKTQFLLSINDRFDYRTYAQYCILLGEIDYLEVFRKKRLTDFSIEEIKDLLRGQKTKPSIKAINIHKSIIARYIKEVLYDKEFLVSLNTARDELVLGDKEDIRQLYPKDYDSLYDYILKYIPYIIQQNPFYLMVVFFSYFGLEVKEMLALKPKNVDFIKNRIINDDGIILIDNLPHSFMSIIRQSFMVDRIYVGFTRYDVHECDFLIKRIEKSSTNTNGIKNSDINYLKKTMDFFNGIRNWDFIEDTPLLFSQTNLKKAGYFHKIYMYELVNGEIGYLSQRQYDTVFQKIIGHARKKAANFYLEYENWRNTYYN